MRYYKQISDGVVTAVGTGLSGVEITGAEYYRIIDEIREKVVLVEQLYSAEITLADVPVEWRDEIERRVNERRAADAAAGEEEATAEDIAAALEVIL